MSRALTMECCALKCPWMPTEIEFKLSYLDEVTNTIAFEVSALLEIA